MVGLDKATRDHLARLERQQNRRDSDRMAAALVRDGVMETVALERERGASFETAKAAPVRRMPGLTWLYRKGKLSKVVYAAGLAYGEAYQAAAVEPGMRSCLCEPTGGGIADPAKLAKAARARVNAKVQLTAMRVKVRSRRLVDALDLVCGLEKTPREATANGSEASALEALVLAALDLLADVEPELAVAA